MQSFLVLTPTERDRATDAVESAVTEELHRLGQPCESLAVATADRERVRAARGVVLLAVDSASKELAGLLGRGPSALASKPIAVVTSSSREGAGELVAALCIDHGAFCGPRPLGVGDEDVDEGGALRAAAAERVCSLIGDFVIFSRAIGYFEMNCTQLEEQIETASRQYEITLDAQPPDAFLAGLQVNHLNVMASNLEESLVFYSEVLGARYVSHLGPNKVATSVNGFELFIEEADRFDVDENLHLGVRTTRDGVLAFVTHLKRLGIPLVAGNSPLDRPHLAIDGERAAIYFRDPAGLLIEVYSPEAMTLRIEEAERRKAEDGARAPRS